MVGSFLRGTLPSIEVNLVNRVGREAKEQERSYQVEIRCHPSLKLFDSPGHQENLKLEFPKLSFASSATFAVKDF